MDDPKRSLDDVIAELQATIDSQAQRIAELEDDLKAIRKACPEYMIRQNERDFQKRLREIQKKEEQ